MIDWLKGLFKEDRNVLVGTLKWTIHWTDMGCDDRGIWLLYETDSGKRSFDISNKATMTGKKEHPGYGDVLAWSQGGDWPLGANKTGKEKNNG